MLKTERERVEKKAGEVHDKPAEGEGRGGQGGGRLEVRCHGH